jgi:hypothetical protein
MVIVPFYRSIGFASVLDFMSGRLSVTAVRSRLATVSMSMLSQRHLLPVFLRRTVALPGLPAGQQTIFGGASCVSCRRIRQQIDI